MFIISARGNHHMCLYARHSDRTIAATSSHDLSPSGAELNRLKHTWCSDTFTNKLSFSMFNQVFPPCSINNISQTKCPFISPRLNHSGMRQPSPPLQDGIFRQTVLQTLVSVVQ